MNFILRSWQIIDAQIAAELATENISSFMSDAFPGNSIEKWERFITNANENPSAFYRVIEVDGKFAGNIGVLIQPDILCLNAELGYWIGNQYKCKGIMTEAIKETVKLVFENFDVKRIFATPFGNNFASQRVLEKAGFKLEGMFDNVYIKNGHLRDQMVFAIRR